MRGGGASNSSRRPLGRLRRCRCVRSCGANRRDGERGRCGSTALLKVASHGPHFGEERPLVGRGGSGTIFFSNCNLLCCFCQNWEINHRGDGDYVTDEELAEMMLRAAGTGLPQHQPRHADACRAAHRQGRARSGRSRASPAAGLQHAAATTAWTSSGAGWHNRHLPAGLQYQDGALAAKYSSGAADYPEVAAAVVKRDAPAGGRAGGGPERGVAVRGLIIRHLVMPQNIAGTDRFVKLGGDAS